MGTHRAQAGAGSSGRGNQNFHLSSCDRSRAPEEARSSGGSTGRHTSLPPPLCPEGLKEGPTASGLTATPGGVSGGRSDGRLPLLLRIPLSTHPRGGVSPPPAPGKSLQCSALPASPCSGARGLEHETTYPSGSDLGLCGHVPPGVPLSNGPVGGPGNSPWEFILHPQWWPSGGPVMPG